MLSHKQTHKHTHKHFHAHMHICACLCPLLTTHTHTQSSSYIWTKLAKYVLQQTAFVPRNKANPRCHQHKQTTLSVWFAQSSPEGAARRWITVFARVWWWKWCWLLPFGLGSFQSADMVRDVTWVKGCNPFMQSIICQMISLHSHPEGTNALSSTINCISAFTKASTSLQWKMLLGYFTFMSEFIVLSWVTKHARSSEQTSVGFACGIVVTRRIIVPWLAWRVVQSRNKCIKIHKARWSVLVLQTRCSFNQQESTLHFSTVCHKGRLWMLSLRVINCHFTNLLKNAKSFSLKL